MPPRNLGAGRPTLFDTSILIPYFARGRYSRDVTGAAAPKRLWLSSLVALELYVGTRDQAEKRSLDAFVASFERRQRVLTPTHADHVLAGILLNRRRRLAGSLEARHHVVDVLIVLSASQIGGTVVTANVEHLGVWAALARRAGRDVRVRAPRELGSSSLWRQRKGEHLRRRRPPIQRRRRLVTGLTKRYGVKGRYGPCSNC